jgi:hypothetical protein
VNRILPWLLDLENIRLGEDAPLVLRWEGPFEAWVLFAFALLAVAWVVMVYRRERTSPVRRWIVAGIRLAVVGLVLALLCQPTLVLQRNRVEPSYVAVLLDTSQSMARAEAYEDEALADHTARGAGLPDQASLTERSRLELALASLRANEEEPVRALLSHHQVLVYTFASQCALAARVPDEATYADSANLWHDLEPTGAATDLPVALEAVLQDAAGRRLAAIVLASDGQSTTEVGLIEQFEQARGRQVPIYALRLGTPTPPRDLEVGPLRAQDRVFAGDLIAIEARLQARGLTKPTTVRVLLYEEPAETPIERTEIQLDPAQEQTTIELRVKPSRTGVVRFRVEVEPLSGERNLENNVDHISVDVLREQLRVLYVEGYPRYEYRYLKNALLREPLIDLSVLLLEADEQFAQEGTTRITRFPTSPEELGRYDVVLFGDVDPHQAWLTAGQTRMLLDFVGNEGGGFGLIAGVRAAPHRFVGSALEKLVPVRIDPQFLGGYETNLTTGYRPQLTLEGRQSRIFRWVAQAEENEELMSRLPDLFWAAQTLGPAAGASVLAEHPTRRGETGPLPLVVLGRYGAGRTFFQGTDDTWLWRRHTGELLHDTYWVRVVRDLMQSRRLARDRRLEVRTDRRTYTYGQPVQITVEVHDPQLLLEHPDEISLTLKDQGDALIERCSAVRLAAGANLYMGTCIPPREGRYVLQPDRVVPQPGEELPSAAVRVSAADLEARRPEANHELLARAATATGGAVLELDDLAVRFRAIRDRSALIPDDVAEPLWDSKLSLFLFVILLAVEWILRKVWGML